MEFFDTHAHLADELLWPIRSEVIERMRQIQVNTTTIINTCEADLVRALDLQKQVLQSEKKRPHLILAAATGPNEVEADADYFFPILLKAAHSGQLVAIGETGLDYHWQTSSVEKQKEWFIRYLELALELHLPIIIHCRKAFRDIIDLLKAHYIGKKGARPGIFHCFSEDWPSACEVVELGFLVSFSGVVTYKSALEIQEVAKRIDPFSYVIETDSPYLTPGKNRSKVNEPANVVLIAEKIASLRGESLTEVAIVSTRNAKRVFGLSNP